MYVAHILFLLDDAGLDHPCRQNAELRGSDRSWQIQIQTPLEISSASRTLQDSLSGSVA